MKVVCMECKTILKVIEDGKDTISHSYCQKCGDDVKKRNKILIEIIRKIEKNQIYEQLLRPNEAGC